ncbi:Signal transduction histidine kinase [Lutibacter oricola]|uniref:histidine kinase n=1 Tax=Lutibacter oricola TaxID=762486 RepID=A0A1H2UFP4_9FLAO|nr:tetratricopeptide repeat protein [Lutibacter oricola]SDW54369.1 Signal transduction histidine kinase [Lutibacter oricola]
MKFLRLFLILFLSFNCIVANNFEEALFVNKFPMDKRLQQIQDSLKGVGSIDALKKLYTYIEVNKKDSLNYVDGTIVLGDYLQDNGDFKKSTLMYDQILPYIKNDYEKLQWVFFKKGANFQRDGAVDSAFVNYKKAVEIGKKVLKHEDLKAKIHGNLLGIYYLKEDYDKAIEHSKIAANYQKKLGNKSIEAGLLNNVGTIYCRQEKYKEALKSFKSALEIVKDGESDLEKQARNVSYINIAYAYSGLGRYKEAYENQDVYLELNDSLHQELKYKEIAEIESKYNVAAKEKIAEIEKERRQKAEYLSYTLGIAILFLLGGIYVLYKILKLNKKNAKLEIQQKQLVHQSKLDKIKSETQSKILAATLDGRLVERKNIASVLHDNISALMSAANLHLFASRKKIKGEIPEEIEKSQSIISEASESIRNLSHTLIPTVLLKFGLDISINDLCEKSSNSKIRLSSEAVNISRFDQDFEIKMFNVISELINNMLKHSNASKGLIKLEQLNGDLKIVVIDNGIGFDINKVRIKDGVGLSQVEARICALGGLIKFNNAEENGSRVFISVPIVY